MRILMVCLGNICRSPLAEGILQKMAHDAGLEWTIDSAGTLSYHVNEMPHILSREVALEHGLDISRQRARQFKASDLEQFDRIYAMANDVLEEMKQMYPHSNIRKNTGLLLDELQPGAGLDVPDPYGGTIEQFRQTYSQIEQACRSIIEKALNEN